MDLEHLETADQVFEALGGYAGLESLTGMQPSAISNWRKSESFPPRLYVLMTEELRARGKEAPVSLWRMVPAEAAS